MDFEIREISSEDANAFCEHFKVVDQETTNLLFEIGERVLNVDFQEKNLKRISAESHRQIFVAFAEENIVGHIFVRKEILKRISHRGTLAIAVNKEFWGSGLATRLMEKALSWFEENEVIRIELNVLEKNKRAIAFYKRFGFKQEAQKIASLKINEKMETELLMARLRLNS